jgi:hypothetical protein
MPLTSTRAIVVRFAILGALSLFVYPFLPAKQKWQMQAALGGREADSLLNEYYEAPAPDALQFSIERDFALFADDSRIADANDIRYVEIAEKVWGEGRVWSIHLRRDAVERLQRTIESNPDISLWAVLDGAQKARYDRPPGEIGSPVYIDPAIFGYTDEYMSEPLEPWYSRPYLPRGPQRLSSLP